MSPVTFPVISYMRFAALRILRTSEGLLRSLKEEANSESRCPSRTIRTSSSSSSSSSASDSSSSASSSSS